MIKRTIAIAAFFLFCATTIRAQTGISVSPSVISFKNAFSRFIPVTFINQSAEPALIDSITYKWYRYFIRFDKYNNFPITVSPLDTIKMDCIYSGYYFAAAADSADTMKIFLRNQSAPIQVPIRILFGEDEYAQGTLSGIVTDTNSVPVVGATVYMFYQNQGLFDSAVSGAGGIFTKSLAKGYYQIAASKNGYLLSWSGNTADPFISPIVQVRRELTTQVNITLLPLPGTGMSISGTVLDSVSAAPVKKGVVVIRKGKHNPDKRMPGTANELTAFSALIDKNGKYLLPALQRPGYYFIQGFSEYFSPGYYAQNSKPALLWQQADSLLISGTVTGKNISLRRDSSYGAGSVTGILSPYALFTDAVLYAIHRTNGKIYSASRVSSTGEFTVENLPFGNYQLLIQRIYNNDLVSVPFSIDSINTRLTNLAILYTGINDATILIPNVLQVSANYPNPFNPETTIRIKQSIGAETELRIYSLTGELVVTKQLGERAGEYLVTISASELPASGVYYYSVHVGKYSIQRKMMLLK